MFEIKHRFYLEELRKGREKRRKSNMLKRENNVGFSRPQREPWHTAQHKSSKDHNSRREM